MYFPNIFGTHDTRENLRVGVVTPDNEASIMADMRRWAAFYNQVVSAYTSLISRETTDSGGFFGSGAAGGEMQPYIEYGETEATNTSETGWSWGAGINRYRDRQQYTEEYLFTATLDQLSKDTIAATNRNYTTRVKVLLRAIFNNVTRVYKARKKFPETENRDITVYPLFNADSRPGTISVDNGVPFAVGSLQSYLPSGSNTLVKSQFQLARSTLRDRGMVGRVMHLVSRADADTVRGMSGFIPRVDPNAGQYAQTTPAPSATTAIVTRPEAIGTFQDGGTSGADGEVVAFPFFPSGYSFSFDKTQAVPIVVRKSSIPQLQGFQLRQDDTKAPYGDHALRNKRWEDILGAGVENQANGVVIQATTGSYAIPSLAIPVSA